MTSFMPTENSSSAVQPGRIWAMAAIVPASADLAARLGGSICSAVLIIRKRLTSLEASDQRTSGQASWKQAWSATGRNACSVPSRADESPRRAKASASSANVCLRSKVCWSQMHLLWRTSG